MHFILIAQVIISDEEADLDVGAGQNNRLAARL